MKKIDEQLARIDSMLQQLLDKENAEGPDETGGGGDGGDSCPTCGQPMPHPQGRLLVMVTKKKAGAAPDLGQMPSILKDVLAAMAKK